jgi:class 3 adenylate cyclase/pimeloyl-ACP methyl ester carboxylesterase
MGEPRIQYAQTKDGVSIAFSTLGEGMPLVLMRLGNVTPMELEWGVLENRSFLRSLAQKRRIVVFNFRGSGLSEGDPSDFSLDAWVADVAAVVDRLELDRFALLGSGFSGPAAVAYAAANPERVSHLILFCTTARGSDFLSSPRDRALGRLMESDFELYTETMAHLTCGWSAGEAARQLAAWLREAFTPEKIKTVNRAIVRTDAATLLPQVKCPALVIHRRQVTFLQVDAARASASRIPNARLTLLEGDSFQPYLGDTEAVLHAIDDFLGEGEEVAARAEPSAPGAFRTILFTDVEGSTAMTQRLGDAKARDLLRQHGRIVREALKSHGGSELKMMGDGFMASFSSAVRALESAIAMQRAFAAHNESAAEPILVRVGLNAGEPIEEEEDLFGTAVIAAARIAAQAEGGQILVANVVRELAAGKDFLFTDRGEVKLRGFDDPVRLYEVRWREEG